MWPNRYVRPLIPILLLVSHSHGIFHWDLHFESVALDVCYLAIKYHHEKSPHSYCLDILLTSSLSLTVGCTYGKPIHSLHHTTDVKMNRHDKAANIHMLKISWLKFTFSNEFPKNLSFGMNSIALYWTVTS